MNRDVRAAMAQQTLAIIERGCYRNMQDQEVELSTQFQYSITNTQLYTPDMFPADLSGAYTNRCNTCIEVTGETTLGAASRLVQEGERVVCLNFASAKNPGGGFLSGSQAQEESLARSSGLYACIAPMQQMYTHNRALRHCLYSDHMIYSPDVPVFRDDDGDLLTQPYAVSIITAPAVNVGAVRKNTPQRIHEIQPTMFLRLQRVLWVAASRGYRVIVLGAWGCGVFGNDPEMVAQITQQALGPGAAFAGAFDRVVLAIHDRSIDQKVLTPFRQLLGG